MFGRLLKMLAIMVLLLPATGCYDFSGDLTREKELLEKERNVLEKRMKRIRLLLEERDRAMQKLNLETVRLDQLKQYVTGREAGRPAPK